MTTKNLSQLANINRFIRDNDVGHSKYSNFYLHIDNYQIFIGAVKERDLEYELQVARENYYLEENENISLHDVVDFDDYNRFMLAVISYNFMVGEEFTHLLK